MFKANVLKAAIDAKGTTATVVAKKCGLTPSTVLRMVSGESKNPRSDNVTSIAAFLEIPVASLFSEETPSVKIAQQICIPVLKFQELAASEVLRSKTKLTREDILERSNPTWQNAPSYCSNPNAFYFAIQVDGTELAPLILPGDTVYLELVEDEANATAGSIVLAFAKNDKYDRPILVLRKLLKGEYEGSGFLTIPNPEWPKETLSYSKLVAIVVGRNGPL